MTVFEGLTRSSIEMLPSPLSHSHAVCARLSATHRLRSFDQRKRTTTASFQALVSLPFILCLCLFLRAPSFHHVANPAPALSRDSLKISLDGPPCDNTRSAKDLQRW